MVKLYLRLWSICAFVSGVAHFVAPVFMASGTSWPLSGGWQREIALFDVMLAIFLSTELRTRPTQNLGNLVMATASLSLALGLNHLWSGLTGGWGYLHVAGCLANACAVIVGYPLFLWKKISFHA